MDREPEELQFLGLPGILTSSAALIAGHRHRRLFGQITAGLILPLSLLFLLHIHISHALFSRIHADERALDRAPPDSPSESRLLNLLSSEWSLFLLFKAVYLLFLLIFALLSTSAVVYTVACIFTAKEVTFAKLFTVIPKVWKRLMLTFLWAFLFLLGYNLSSAIAIVCLILLVGRSAVGVALVVALVTLYIMGLVWISVVWHLASVVSVLEDACGLSAMKKSRNLIKGKGRVACGIFTMLNLAFIAIELGFKMLVVKGRTSLGLGFGARFGFGLLFAVMLLAVILLGLVAQTVVYFVCKSYHHESIDKSSLADHLEVYLGEYVPLKGRDVQMEQYYA